MIRARFVGVGRFADANISELTGCARDATALCALFQDTVADIDAAALVDARANHQNVNRAIVETLSDSSADDAVILSFATHGTRDHRIVVHDTDLARIAETTLSMVALADAFRQCRARFVLCILDCCFGGAAPARVVLDTPVNREIVDLGAFEGIGRLLLTASRLDEPAYEHPVRRHGLLTAALIDALTSGEHNGVLALVEHVVGRVRTDALAMGIVQNPVATTYVDGGFALPVLVRGRHFYAAFPEHAGVRVERVSDLRAFDIPDTVVAEWVARYSDHLHDLQTRAINDHRVLDGGSLFVVAPTSSGKTFIGELAAVRAIAAGRKAVFILPYKALVNEKYDDFQALYGERLEMRVVRCTGDHHDRVREFISGRFDIALLTYEMFLGLAVANSALLNTIGLIVLDEAQLITDKSRGINVELLITLLRSARVRQVAPQLVLLSATVGALNHFDEWLEIDVLRSDTRPVPLEVGVLDRAGTFQYQDATGQTGSRQLLAERVRQRRDAPSSQDVIVPLLRQLLADEQAGETVIVFRNTKGSAEGCANYLAAELGLPPATAALAALPTGDLSASSPRLRSALSGGTAFHTANLSREERVVVERSFRSQDGSVRVLAATTGMAAGINTPASTVIVAETAFRGGDREAMSVGEVRNMAGRAGRYGYRETGRAIILADTPLDRQRLFRTYVQSPSEAIGSSFAAEDLSTWVVRLLRQVERIGRPDVSAMLLNTFGGYLQARRDPGFLGRVTGAVPQLLRQMEGNGLIAEDEHGVRLTPLGRACGQSTLSFESCLRLIGALRSVTHLMASPEVLLAVTEALPESDETYVPLQRRGPAEYRWGPAMTGRLGAPVMRMLSNGVEVFVGLARAKRTLIALAWADGLPIEQIEQNFSVNPFNAVAAGDIRSVADSVRFRLRSVWEIAAVACPEHLPNAEGMDGLFLRLEFGVPARGLALLRLGPSFARAEHLQLINAGFTSAEQLWDVPAEILRQHLSAGLSEKLERIRPRRN